MDFHCIEDCAECCIQREYYPSKKFGKVGVLILPEEKEIIESHAKKFGLEITILPRIGISYEKSNKPTKILAYQMMGRERNGNTCPFLDTETNERSPHGGFPCKIYQNRPLACKAYPVIETSPIIKTTMITDAPFVWRFATGVGEDSDNDVIDSGWILVS